MRSTLEKTVILKIHIYSVLLITIITNKLIKAPDHPPTQYLEVPSSIIHFQSLLYHGEPQLSALILSPSLDVL
jgi:hypothetical protein